MYGLKQMAAPTEEPVTIRQIKQQLAIHPNDVGEDVRLWRLAKAARQKIERISGYCCLTQVWQLTLDVWLREIRLPRLPVLGVDLLEGRNPENVWLPASPNDYELDTSQPVARIRILSSSTPPLHKSYKPIVRVTFTCGHSTREEVPEDLRAAILRQTEDEDRFRGAGEYSSLAESVVPLLIPFTVPDEALQYGRGEYAGVD